MAINAHLARCLALILHVMKYMLYLLCCLLPGISDLAGQGLTIQENETGFCSVDGIIDTDVPGYTGDGFANADIAAGTSALWNIDVHEDDTFVFYWKYANGGGAGDLVAEIWINEVPVITDFTFQHTGAWTNWVESDTVSHYLESGENRIRLVSVSESGLPNIDFFHVITSGAEPAFCQPSYMLKLAQNYDAWGTIAYSPEQPFYDAGTEITLMASASPGYFFQSWSGNIASADSHFTFTIDRNAVIEALFYPDGTAAEKDVMGYATVQDDAGTPYLMTGGLFGDTVLATTFPALRTFLEFDQPLVVTVAEHIISTGTINIKSDKTLLGITDSAHLEGIRIKINDADNVIIRNMTFSKVVQFDAIEINHSRHIWIDHCVFFSDRDHDKDYYDGLLDIKNAASFITVSNTEFRDHFKAVLISSGDDSVPDTAIRITFYRNYFHELGSRTPLLRFGKAHIFNNYFKHCNSGINARMGACIRVEENFFFKVNPALRVDMSQVVGFFELAGNVFEQSSYGPLPPCSLDVPYAYLHLLADASEIPMLVAGEDPLTSLQPGIPENSITVYPNPAKEAIRILFGNPPLNNVSVTLLDCMGREVQTREYPPAEFDITLAVGHQPRGIYVLCIRTGDLIIARRIIIQPD